jgi:hypothetical protein
MCPQKLKTFWLMADWNPSVKARATIMTATLIPVAMMARRMMNLEKVRSGLKAIRWAINRAMFKARTFVDL